MNVALGYLHGILEEWKTRLFGSFHVVVDDFLDQFTVLYR